MKMKETKEVKEMKEIKETTKGGAPVNSVGSVGSTQAAKTSNVGRPYVFRWPGLEESTYPPFPLTRQQQLRDAEIEAATREEKYGSEVDLFNFKFDVGPDGAHTTIDFDKFSLEAADGEENDGVNEDVNGNVNGSTRRALITTSDFIIYNKIKKLMAAGKDVEIVDLKFNIYKNAVFFVTASVPLPILKKVLQKY